MNRPSNAARPGLTTAAAFLATLVGTWLWLLLIQGPLDLVSGLSAARRDLDATEDALATTALKAAGREAAAAAAAVERARAALDAPLLDVARIVPSVSRLLDEVPHLVAAAGHSAEAAATSVEIAQTVLRGPDSVVRRVEGQGSVIRLDRIRAIAETISGVRNDVRAARAELSAVALDALPQRLRDPIRRGIARARETDAVLADAEAGFAVLPAVLGADEPRVYLIGMQNSAEQRGTGGAILQFALLAITEGKPTLPRTRGSVYKIDKNRQRIFIDLPDDAWYVAGIPDAQRFGNSNWSPDWPLSARLMLDYAAASDPNFPSIDGFIAVDPLVMQKLMPGIGKYRSSAGNVITTRKVVHFVLYKAYASFPIPAIRRHVLETVVDGFYEGMLDPDHPTLLIKGMSSALAHKNMQIWLADPAEQAFVERMDWDAAIRRAEKSDYLYVVEQNVGGNKLDNFARQTITTEIRLEGDDALTSTRVEATNRVFLPQPRWSMGDSGPDHLPMLNVYVPARAELLDSSVDGIRLDTPAPAAWVGGMPPEHLERGKKVWSATLQIPPHDAASIAFDYRVPAAVRTAGGRKVYRLVVQHQPKVQPDRLVVRFGLPSGAREVRAPGWRRDGDTLVWDRNITRDLTLEVTWRS